MTGAGSVLLRVKKERARALAKVVAAAAPGGPSGSACAAAAPRFPPAGQFLRFDLRNGSLRKKFDGLKYTLKVGAGGRG